MELANLIVEAVLKEAVTDKVVVYGGRFQPFHKGHKKVYDSLVAKFGSKNVYIATSDVQDSDKSPLSFNEKKEIATKLFGIPASKFIKVKQPYQPVEILRGFDDTTTALIVAVGEKDDSRLGGNYFKPYKNDKDLKGYAVNAYVYTQLPSNSFGATDVRNMFRNKRMGDKRKEAEFTKFFGKFDKTIYNKLDKKLNEGVNTDNIPGGLAKGKTLIDLAKKWDKKGYYDPKQYAKEYIKPKLMQGIKVEMEHTTDVRIATEIAMDHLWEDIKYYDKLAKIETPKEIKEENPLYQPDEMDLENILGFEIADPSDGKKYTIRQALKLPKTTFARQEAMRILRLLVAKNHISGAGHLSKTLFPPNEDEPKNKLNLSLGTSYGESVDLDEASARGSGYDETTLDKLVKNPETGEQVKVRSALNYKKDHPAYKAAIALVRKVGSKLPKKKVGGQKHPVAIKQTPQAKAHTQPTTQPVLPTNNAPKQPSKIQPAAGQPKQPVQQNTVPLDKVKQDIPNFNVKDKSDINKVTPEQQKNVSMKIDDLAKAAAEAKAKGEKAPNFNLCDITIPGTNLYCGGNKGIERAKMPQFKGTPQPGSDADKMQKDKNGEVDTEEMFKKMLQDKGIKVSEPTSVPADQLKATQTELVGAKVAGMTKALEADPNHPGITAPIYVSSDGYVLDGHHRWAAVTSHEIASGKPANMNVRVIDMPIEELVKVSNQFAQDIGVQAKAADANKETPSGLAPTSSKEKDAKGAGVGKVTTKAVQNPQVVKRAIKSKIQKWSDKEKNFFRNGEHKPNSETRRSIGEAINAKIKSIVPSVKREMEHLGHEFKSAGEGIGNLFNGKPLDERHKAAFKSLGKTVALSALGVAIGGGIGHGAGVFMKHLGGHMAEHLVAELVAGGIGKAAIFAGTEMEGDTDKHIEWFILYFAKQMKDGEIPADVWENALQDYNNDKEDGKVHEDDWDRPEQQNEVLTEMSSNDIHFKNVMKHYKSNKFTKRINMYLFGKPTKGNSNDVARALRNMGYKEITDMEKELNIADLEEDINVNVDKGDEVLMGKFKNKKVVVKDLGKDSHGMPTINGKQATTFRKVDEGLILEGGAYGHMNHPFDIRMNLSFGDLKNIVNNALDGKLGVVREKTDGQALAISWKNGRLIAARNKGHLANAGANAMDINGVASKFGGRGGLTDAYNFAMKDLENAIRGLSKAQKDKIFKEGKVFVNLEVIWPTSVNVIPYNQALLVFHNAVEYNDAGNAIGKVDGAESILGGMIKQINAHVQSKYTIQGPPIVELPKNKTLSSQKGKFNGMISKLQSEFGLSDKDGVADYHQAWWENFVDKSKKKIKPLEKAGLVKRWAFDDKSFRIADITDDKAREWAEGIEKGPKASIMAGNLRKFEDIFLGVGAQVLSFMSSVLTAQPDKALQTMRKELETTANAIMNGGTITQIKKLEKELARLNAIGGFEKIVPSEGIVFQYKGNAYKLTGAFAPLNQILGIFKFSR